MLKYVVPLCAGLALALSASAASAQSVSVGPGGVRIDDGYRHHRHHDRYIERRVYREPRAEWRERRRPDVVVIEKRRHRHHHDRY